MPQYASLRVTSNFSLPKTESIADLAGDRRATVHEYFRSAVIKPYCEHGGRMPSPSQCCRTCGEPRCCKGWALRCSGSDLRRVTCKKVRRVTEATPRHAQQHIHKVSGRGRPAGWRPISARRALLPTLGHRANILGASRGGMFNAAGLSLLAYRSPVSVHSLANELE